MSTLNENKILQISLRVTRKTYITPHYIRIYLTGENVLQIANTTVGVNNKVLIPPAGLDVIHFPEFDFEKGQWKPQADAIRPFIRTYTHRGIDVARNEIWIDFIAHGEEGPASAWAMHAKVGDPLGVLMKDGKTDLYIATQHYLLVGDATAIPILGAILEDLPATASGRCIIEVHSKEDEQVLPTNANIQFTWLYNTHPQQGSRLADVVKGLSLPGKDRFAYVASEFDTVKDIRNFLRKEQGWERRELYAYAYWKAGLAEDRSAGHRHAESNER